MKKNYAFCLLFLLASCLVYSQPTITYNGNAPVIGDVYYYSNTDDVLDPGPAGPNQTWDFSNINVTSTNQATIMDPAGTPFNSDFPGCNQTFHFNETTTYIYYDLTQSEMIHYGEGFDNNPPQIIYFSDPRKEIEYPFSFNNSFTDTYYTAYEYEGMTTHRSGTAVVTADAWGSLTTPVNNYGSVLRTQGIYSQVDSVWMDGVFMYVTATLYTHYSWHTASSHTPVMVISIVETNFGTTYTSHYTTSSQHVINPQAGISNLEVYPNPVDGEIYISLVPFEVEYARISVVDLTGKELMYHEEQFFTNNECSIRLDLINLSPGVYFMKIDDGIKPVTRKIIVK